MGIRVLEADPDRVRIGAPLEPNLNHHATAFGGSVAVLATLAGWALVHLRLAAEGLVARTVIQDSSVRYDSPIDRPFEAVSRRVTDASWTRFTRTLARRGKARLRVGVDVESGGLVAARFEGAFVSMVGSD